LIKQLEKLIKNQLKHYLSQAHKMGVFINLAPNSGDKRILCFYPIIIHSSEACNTAAVPAGPGTPTGSFL
jgi:hypothetical protein